MHFKSVKLLHFLGLLWIAFWCTKRNTISGVQPQYFIAETIFLHRKLCNCLCRLLCSGIESNNVADIFGSVKSIGQEKATRRKGKKQMVFTVSMMLIYERNECFWLHFFFFFLLRFNGASFLYFFFSSMLLYLRSAFSDFYHLYRCRWGHERVLPSSFRLSEI